MCHKEEYSTIDLETTGRWSVQVKICLLTQREKYDEEKVLRTGHELPRGLVLRKGRHRTVNTKNEMSEEMILAKYQARDCRKRSCKRACGKGF